MEEKTLTMAPMIVTSPQPLLGSLSALVSQHSISPISLPCCLRIPSKGE
jgi:hypothetical protein